MSNIIILAGSERKDGNTDMLVDAFKKGAAKKNKVEVISVRNHKINRNDGRSLCCRSRDRSGKCGIAKCFKESRFCEEWSNWRRRSQICLQRKRK
jgi:multimeric flavodoxin WrbA